MYLLKEHPTMSPPTPHHPLHPKNVLKVRNLLSTPKMNIVRNQLSTIILITCPVIMGIDGICIAYKCIVIKFSQLNF